MVKDVKILLISRNSEAADVLCEYTTDTKNLLKVYDQMYNKYKILAANTDEWYDLYINGNVITGLKHIPCNGIDILKDAKNPFVVAKLFEVLQKWDVISAVTINGHDFDTRGVMGNLCVHIDAKLWSKCSKTLNVLIEELNAIYNPFETSTENHTLVSVTTGHVGDHGDHYLIYGADF